MLYVEHKGVDLEGGMYHFEVYLSDVYILFTFSKYQFQHLLSLPI